MIRISSGVKPIASVKHHYDYDVSKFMYDTDLSLPTELICRLKDALSFATAASDRPASTVMII